MLNFSQISVLCDRSLSKSWTLSSNKNFNARRQHSIASPCLIQTLLFNHKFKSPFKLKYPTLSPLAVVYIQEGIYPLGTVHWRNKAGEGSQKAFNLLFLPAYASGKWVTSAHFHLSQLNYLDAQYFVSITCFRWAFIYSYHQTNFKNRVNTPSQM